MDGDMMFIGLEDDSMGEMREVREVCVREVM